RGVQSLLLPLRRGAAAGREHERHRFREQFGRLRGPAEADPLASPGHGVLRADRTGAHAMKGTPEAGTTRSPRAKVTAPNIVEMKRRGELITSVTAYDFPTARLADEAGVDIVLVGDSVGTVVLGYESTLPVTVDDIVHHTRAVARAKPRALVVADMPFM